MVSFSHEDCICAMFDSFCKTVSRNFVRNLDWVEGNRDKHFATKFFEGINNCSGSLWDYTLSDLERRWPLFRKLDARTLSAGGASLTLRRCRRGKWCWK